MILSLIYYVFGGILSVLTFILNQGGSVLPSKIIDGFNYFVTPVWSLFYTALPQTFVAVRDVVVFLFYFAIALYGLNIIMFFYHKIRGGS